MKRIPASAPGLDPSIIVRSGATSLKQNIPPQFLAGVQVAYNKALTQTFYVPVALASLSVLGAAVIEWKSVKGKKLETVAA